MRRDKAHAAHIGSERVHLVDSVGSLEAVFAPPQVQYRKLVRRARLVLRMLEIRASYPVALLLEIADQMVPDEPTGPRYQDSLHERLLPTDREIKPALELTAVAAIIPTYWRADDS